MTNRKPKVTFQEEAEDLEEMSERAKSKAAEEQEITDEPITSSESDMKSSNENLSVSTFKPSSESDKVGYFLG